MIKKELIDAVAEKSNLTKNDTSIFLENLIEVISEEVTKGNQVKLIGFGIFSRKKVKGREGISQLGTSKGQAWKTEDSFSVKFSVGKEFEDRVNGK